MLSTRDFLELLAVMAVVAMWVQSLIESRRLRATQLAILRHLNVDENGVSLDTSHRKTDSWVRRQREQASA